MITNLEFQRRAKDEIDKIRLTMERRGIRAHGTLRVDPHSGHSFANIYGVEGHLLHYRAKSIDELSRQLEAVRTTLETLEEQG
jgi:hypothetical protein